MVSLVIYSRGGDTVIRFLRLGASETLLLWSPSLVTSSPLHPRPRPLQCPSVVSHCSSIETILTTFSPGGMRCKMFGTVKRLQSMLEGHVTIKISQGMKTRVVDNVCLSLGKLVETLRSGNYFFFLSSLTRCSLSLYLMKEKGKGETYSVYVYWPMTSSRLEVQSTLTSMTSVRRSSGGQHGLTQSYITATSYDKTRLQHYKWRL